MTGCGRLSCAGIILLTAILSACVGLSETTRHPKLPETVPSAAKGAFDKVLIIVLENQDYSAAMRNETLRRIADQGVLLANFHGLFHPSYSNYLAMISGRRIETNLDFQGTFAGPTIADRLDAAEPRLSWKNYAEAYPGGGDRGCYTGYRLDSYARKHVPFLSFRSVQESQCDRVVPGAQLWTDLAEGDLPTYSFYSPDLNNDGHDTGLAAASNWLEGFLAELQKSASRPNAPLRRVLIVVTFDESGNAESNTNHIYTALLGDVIANPGMRLDAYLTHFDLLRLIEDNFGLAPLGDGDGGAAGIPACVFGATATSPCVER